MYPLPPCPLGGKGYIGAMTVIEVDARKRVSLGSFVTPGKRYIVSTDSSGAILLTPAVVMSELEARLLSRPDILGAVERSRAAGVFVDRPERQKQA